MKVHKRKSGKFIFNHSTPSIALYVKSYKSRCFHKPVPGRRLVEHWAPPKRNHWLKQGRNLCSDASIVIMQQLTCQEQGRNQPVSLGRGAISLILAVKSHYGFATVRYQAYFTTLLWQNNGRENGLISRMLFPNCSKFWWKKLLSEL